MLMAALAATLWASSAQAVTDVQWGNSTRGVQQLRLVGGVLASDSSGRVLLFDSAGNLLATDPNTLNTLYDNEPDIYNDTLSVNGRSYDSTSVVDCSLYPKVVLGLKMSGHKGATVGIVRIAITPIWSQSALGTDTTASYARFIHSGQVGSATATVDSIGPAADAANVHVVIPGHETLVRFMTRSIINTNPTMLRSVAISYTNPGYRYVRFLIRVLSDTATDAYDLSGGVRFRLRASAGLRAL